MLRRLIASLVYLSLFCASAPEAVHAVFHVMVSSLQHAEDGGGCCQLHSSAHGHEVKDAAVFTAASLRRQHLPAACPAGDLPRTLQAPVSAGAPAARYAGDFFAAARAVPLIPQLLPIPPPVIHKS